VLEYSSTVILGQQLNGCLLGASRTCTRYVCGRTGDFSYQLGHHHRLLHPGPDTRCCPPPPYHGILSSTIRRVYLFGNLCKHVALRFGERLSRRTSCTSSPGSCRWSPRVWTSAVRNVRQEIQLPLAAQARAGGGDLTRQLRLRRRTTTPWRNLRRRTRRRVVCLWLRFRFASTLQFPGRPPRVRRALCAAAVGNVRAGVAVSNRTLSLFALARTLLKK
jgi:hypothetical protein